MPVITMKLGNEQLSEQQKRTFIETVTQTAAEITGISAQSFLVFVEELDTDNIGVGGKVLSDVLRARSKP